MRIPVLLKEPGENFVVGFDFSARLPTGRSLDSGTVAAVNLSDDSDASATVLASTTATISDMQALVRVQSGTAWVSYAVTFTVTLDDASVLEEQLHMKVVAI